jgi:uncharacterized protein YdeI (YjbR/CyaY-like superfamily)
MEQLYCSSLPQWHKWLLQNHAKTDSIWLEFHKKSSLKKSINYDEALDEALCFGWIDSIIKRIDENIYVRKFSKRNAISKWSLINKKRVENLIKSGRMSKAGYDIINKAKENGSWDRPDRIPIIKEVPEVFQKALDKNKPAKEYFNSLAPSHRKRYIMWIGTAKRKETSEKRINEAISMLKSKMPLGLK